MKHNISLEVKVKLDIIRKKIVILTTTMGHNITKKRKQKNTIKVKYKNRIFYFILKL